MSSGLVHGQRGAPFTEEREVLVHRRQSPARLSGLDPGGCSSRETRGREERGLFCWLSEGGRRALAGFMPALCMGASTGRTRCLASVPVLRGTLGHHRTPEQEAAPASPVSALRPRRD